MSDKSPLDLLIRKLDGHVALGDGDKAAIGELPHMLRELPPAAYIVREGEVPGSCAVLLKGFAFRQKLVVTGERQIMSVQFRATRWTCSICFDRADHNVQALRMCPSR